MISAAPRIARATVTAESVTERDSSRSSRWSRVPTSCSSAATRRFSSSSLESPSSRAIAAATSATRLEWPSWWRSVDSMW